MRSPAPGTFLWLPKENPAPSVTPCRKDHRDQKPLSTPSAPPNFPGDRLNETGGSANSGHEERGDLKAEGIGDGEQIVQRHVPVAGFNRDIERAAQPGSFGDRRLREASVLPMLTNPPADCCAAGEDPWLDL